MEFRDLPGSVSNLLLTSLITPTSQAPQRMRASLQRTGRRWSYALRERWQGSRVGQWFTNRQGREHLGIRLSDYTGTDTIINAALASMYTQAVTTRREFLVEMDRIKPFYLVQALFNSLIEDSLSPDITTGEVVQLMSQKKAVNAELRTLQTLFSFDQIINDIVHDLIGYGEYSLRLVTESGHGLRDIVDDVDQSRIVAFYHQGYPYRYIRQTRRDLEVFPAYAYAHFVAGWNRLRVGMNDEFLAGEEEELGDYVDEWGFPYPAYSRVGRPMLYGCLAKMKELIILEQLIPAGQLNRILTGSLVSLQLPPSYSPDEAFEAARRYENVINQKVGLDRSTADLTVTDILSTAGKIRVLPQLGDKGQLTNINELKELRTMDDLLQSVQDIRGVICGSLGFPPELFFGGREPGPKSDFLKRYARYVRKLRGLQSSIGHGLTQIALVHLVNKGIKADVEDIQVVFRNELINLDELEKLEFSDAVVQSLLNIDSFVTQLSQGPMAQVVDPESYHAFLYQTLSAIGHDSCFIKPPKGMRDRGQELELDS